MTPVLMNRFMKVLEDLQTIVDPIMHLNDDLFGEITVITNKMTDEINERMLAALHASFKGETIDDETNLRFCVYLEQKVKEMKEIIKKE